MKLRVLLLMVGLLIVIIPAQAQDVEIDSILFARDVSYGDVTPIQADTVFPNTLTVLYAIISGDGLEDGDEIEIVWNYEGDEIDSIEFTNDTGDEEFSIWSNWINEDGMTVGAWSVEIVYDGDVIGEAEFEVTDDPYIFPIRFAQDCGRATNTLINENTQFEDTPYIYALIEWANFDDAEIGILWTIDGEVFDFDITLEVDGEGTECTFLVNGGDPMPEGEYTVIVVDEDKDPYRESAEIDIEE
ncbi:MAG: DUF2914 domain-containing protein [Phototrophicaceae bacterium]